MDDHTHARADDPFSTPWDVVVVGSGLAGLVAAATASRLGATVALVEGPTRDGRARTVERDGFSLNLGPHALYDRGAARQVLDRLGVTVDGVRPPTDGVLAWQDRTAPLPQGLGALVRPPLGVADTARLGRAMLRIARLDPVSVAHLTIDEWLEQLLPERPRAVLAAFARVASYCVDTDVVSADVAVHQLRLAARGVTYVHGGWCVLADAIRAGAPNVHVVPGTARAVTELDHPVVHTDAGSLIGRRVVLAVGSATATAALLPGHPAPPSWGRAGPAVEASCLDLGLRRAPTIRAWFGVDQPHYLVAHAPGARLAPDGASLVHAMRNLRHDETAPHDDLRDELRALAERAGIADDDVVFSRHLHRMVVVSSSVTPAGGGLAGRPAVTDTGQNAVLVAGDWVGSTGWLADASAASGEQAGRLAAEARR